MGATTTSGGGEGGGGRGGGVQSDGATGGSAATIGFGATNNLPSLRPSDPFPPAFPMVIGGGGGGSGGTFASRASNPGHDARAFPSGLMMSHTPHQHMYGTDLRPRHREGLHGHPPQLVTTSASGGFGGALPVFGFNYPQQAVTSTSASDRGLLNYSGPSPFGGGTAPSQLLRLHGPTTAAFGGAAMTSTPLTAAGNMFRIPSADAAPAPAFPQPPQ